MKANNKKGLRLVFACSLLVFCVTGCGAVDKIKEVVSSEDPVITYSVDKHEFYFSTDNGSTYGNKRIEFEVGKSVYMQLVIKVGSSDDKKHDITGQLKIPNVKTVDSYYMQGQKITPNQDDINGFSIYPFDITTNEEWVFIFEFVPNSEEVIQMELEFDEPVPEKYKFIKAIKMVDGKDEEKATGGDGSTEEGE